jgi:hypothetical protein
MNYLKYNTENPKNIVKILILAILMITIQTGCSDYLDIVPDNVATIDYAFRDRAGAESYMAGCYSYMPYWGDPAHNPGLMGGDDTWALYDTWTTGYVGNYNCYNIKLSQNTNAPYVDSWLGALNGRGLYVAIRECNVFLENIDKVGPDLSAAEKARFIAEVKFLKAYYHYCLLRQYGPIVLVKQNLPVDAGIDETKVYREKFDDCINYIAGLIDEAVPELPDVIYDEVSELRRITQPIALSIKAEMMVLAASPLFSDNEYLSGMIDNRGVNLMESDMNKQDKWIRAREACSEAIENIRAGGKHVLYNFTQSTYYSSYQAGISDTSKLLMTLRTVVTDKWNRETIWGTANSYTRETLPHFTVAHATLAATEPIIAPTLRAVELFYSSHGVPVDEDTAWINNGWYIDRYKYEPAPESEKYYMLTDGDYKIAKLNMNREPRFYANLAFDGSYWLGNGTKVDFDREPAAQRAWVMKMLRGNPTGNYLGIRYAITGYDIKKGSHIETAVNSAGTSLTTVQSTFPIIRLADLYLLYAEALNEAEDSQAARSEAIAWLDTIRFRAGLEGVIDSWTKYSIRPDKPYSQEGLREIIHRERMSELAFEGKRFWDVRRWLTAETEMNNPVQGWNIMGEVPEDYYNVVTLHNLTFSKKEYLWPIAQSELQKNPNLIQNPGW